MARIRILQSVAGTDFSWSAGDTVDLPGEEASKWADGYRAEFVREDAAEKAVAGAPEKTARAPRKTRTA